MFSSYCCYDYRTSSGCAIELGEKSRENAREAEGLEQTVGKKRRDFLAVELVTESAKQA